jgi:Ca2+-binding RTX toxin-like protein
MRSPRPSTARGFRHRRRHARTLVAVLVAALAVPLPATPASAAATCAFNSATGVLQVNLGDDDTAYVDRFGDEIRIRTIVLPDVVTVTCTGGTPTVDNTDNMNITGSTGANYLFIILDGGRFAPGATNEPGSSDEIEIAVDLAGASGDQMFVTGAPAGSEMNLRAGAGGINMNAAEATGVDADLTVANVAGLQLFGGYNTPSVISGAGGAGTGAPFPTRLDIRGDSGNDTLTGGAGNDFILADEGNDLIAGGAGFDTLEGFLGRDTVSYKGTSGATVDLAAETAADDGSGSSDSVKEMENVIGGASEDTLYGKGNANRLRGGGGGDHLFGRGGNDPLAGGKGNDELRGDRGDDDLNGGRGTQDLCRGGPGEDTLTNCEL